MEAGDEGSTRGKENDRGLAIDGFEERGGDDIRGFLGWMCCDFY